MKILIYLDQKKFENAVINSSCGLSCPGEDPKALAKLMKEMISLPFKKRADYARNGYIYGKKFKSINVLSKKMDNRLLFDQTEILLNNAS